MTENSNSNNDKGSLPARRPVTEVQRQLPSRSRSRMDSTAVQGNGISPAFVLHVFSQWWKWVIPLGVLLAVVAGSLVWHFYVPQYKAGALVIIQSNVPYIAYEKGHEQRDTNRYIQTQIELLRSSIVLGPVLSQPEIAAMEEFKSANLDPFGHLKNHLTIRQIGQSELYEVSYISPSAADAATIANDVVREYLRSQKQNDRDRSQLVIDKLEKERLVRSARVEQLRKRVVDLAKEITGTDPFGQGVVTNINRVLSPATTLFQNLSEVEVNFEILKAELQALQDAPVVFSDEVKFSALLDLDIANQPDVREFEASIAAINEEMAYVRTMPRHKIGETWEDDLNYQRLKQQSQEMKTTLKELKVSLREELLENQVEERKAGHQLLITSMAKELNSLELRRKFLAEKFNKHLNEMKSGGAQSAQLEFAKAELEREEKVFELIAVRKLSLQTELDAPARISLKQSASVPSMAMEPIPYKVLLIACLASLVCPLALAVAWETMVRRICDSEQLASETLLPVLGEVTRFPVRPVATRNKTLSSRAQREMFIFAESIDSLRTNLMLTENLGTESQSRVVAIVSAVSGEGKTSVATSLAASIAGATKKPTLLIDADLRSPDVARIMGGAVQPGLSEVLEGKASLSEAIHASGQTDTYVLPAGELQVNPHHIIQGQKIENLYDSLRARFSTILVDTPPVLGASESLFYAKAADLVVFCTLSDVSRAKQVRTAVERLQATGAVIAGGVISGVPVGRHAYAYGYDSSTSRVAEIDT